MGHTEDQTVVIPGAPKFSDAALAKRTHVHRTSRKNERTSSRNNSGCSKAAKCPPRPGSFQVPDVEEALLRPPSRRALELLGEDRAAGGNGDRYSREHATRPQTIGYALVDSPAALCAWIIEKFWACTDSPQTIGYALVDSPAALCAWIIEKFWAWTDCDGAQCEDRRALHRSFASRHRGAELWKRV